MHKANSNPVAHAAASRLQPTDNYLFAKQQAPEICVTGSLVKHNCQVLAAARMHLPRVCCGSYGRVWSRPLKQYCLLSMSQGCPGLECGWPARGAHPWH
jgi:hypothetical protein